MKYYSRFTVCAIELIVVCGLASCGGTVRDPEPAGQVNTGGVASGEPINSTPRAQSGGGGVSLAGGAGAGVVASAGGLDAGGTGAVYSSVGGSGHQPSSVSSGGAPADLGGLSGSGGATASGGSAPMGGAGGIVGCGLLIDDMESGNGHICTGEGRKGIWYAFSDAPKRMSPTPTLGIAILPSELSLPRGMSLRAMHAVGKVNNWAGLGIDLQYDNGKYGHYDASAYEGIGFWVRSDVQSALSIRVSTQSTTSTAFGGTCTDESVTGTLDNPQYQGSCHPSEARVVVNSSSWTYVELPFDEFRHSLLPKFLTSELSQITNIQFLAASSPFDFWIDDVSFLPLKSAP